MYAQNKQVPTITSWDWWCYIHKVDIFGWFCISWIWKGGKFHVETWKAKIVVRLWDLYAKLGRFNLFPDFSKYLVTSFWIFQNPIFFIIFLENLKFLPTISQMFDISASFCKISCKLTINSIILLRNKKFYEKYPIIA